MALRSRLATWSLVVVGVLLAGCASDATPSITTGSNASADFGDPVVIALLDSGTTPYYPVFAVHDDAVVAAAVPADFTSVRFPLDPGEDALTRDADLWNSLKPHTLYHFADTRLLGISFDTEARFESVRDASFHGIATSFLAARDAPEAIIVVVQLGLGSCPDQACTVAPHAADGMEWIATQDWIDIVSVSIGVPGNPPERGEVHPDVARYVRATQAAVASGKLVVNAAGNAATPPLAHYFNGPPWIITVGGIEPEAKGEHVLSGKTVDVVANFTDHAPMYGRGDMAWRSGTSFATPIVAGTLANALGKVRVAQPGRVVTPQEMRDALNASAIHFGPTDWDPSPPGRKPLPDDITDYASLPILAQPQMGWGYVDASLADEIARRVLEGDFAIPAGKDQAALFQPRWQQAREVFWDAYG